MAISPLPSLSPDGWVKDTPNKTDYLLSHFFLAEYSQSFLYKGNISSLPFLLQKNSDDFNLAKDVESTLQTYFGRYFSNVVVQSKCTTDATDTVKKSLQIFIEFDDLDGTRFSVGKVADIINSKINRVIQLNNYGG